jgi:flagellar biosynthetic protein FliP
VGDGCVVTIERVKQVSGFRSAGVRAFGIAFASATALVLAGCGATDVAGSAGGAIPKVTFGIDQAQGPQDTVQSIQIIILLTVLSLAPAILIMVTAFTRIIIVLSLIRNAIGVPQLPPNTVLIGLALFLTFFVMAPVAQQVERDAYSPFTDGRISQAEAYAKAEAPFRTFMLRQVREKDLALFVYLGRLDQPKTIDEVPTYVVVPAFIISELKTAFQMGFMIFVPFLVIDLVVSTILMSMGMMMLPPVLISLPFKILLFVMVDGWYLLMRALVLSFN